MAQTPPNTWYFEHGTSPANKWQRSLIAMMTSTVLTDRNVVGFSLLLEEIFPSWICLTLLQRRLVSREGIVRLRPRVASPLVLSAFLLAMTL